MLLVHIHDTNARWKYVLDFVFGLRGINFRTTDSIHEFDADSGLKIALSEWEVGGLMREVSITQSKIDQSHWRQVDCFAFDGVADPFSSIFYTLTRMEEYHPENLDQHGRFEGKTSLQYKFNWLNQCICDHWAMAIISEVEKELGVKLTSKTPTVELIPTFDIDNTYAYLLKKGKRKYLSISKDLVYLNFRRLLERYLVLARKKKDPYDTFESIGSIAEKFPVRMFWLVGDYGNYDKNISQSISSHQNLIRKMSDKAQVGIHPSYASNDDVSMLNIEKKMLEETLQKQIEISRQHFLKLKFPETYQSYLTEGIVEDFTMGFSDQVGFRNGTAHAFPWFDLTKNEPTKLIIRPFAYMDGTLNEYMNLTPEEAKNTIRELFTEVEKWGGDFIFLWHNETIGERGKWKGWKSVLEYTLSLSKAEKS